MNMSIYETYMLALRGFEELSLPARNPCLCQYGGNLRLCGFNLFAEPLPIDNVLQSDIGRFESLRICTQQVLVYIQMCQRTIYSIPSPCLSTPAHIFHI